MDTLKLGHIITIPQQRDATHIAVIPVTAAEDLQPGQHVSAAGVATIRGRGVGVVDPFLTESVEKGERFWLRNFADSVDANYEEMMSVARGHAEAKINKTWPDQYLSEGGKREGQDTPEEFWKHFNELTGLEGSDGIFSCSC